MSKRRLPGEVVRRTAGSGFCGSEEPMLIRVPTGKQYEADTIQIDGRWAINEGGEASSCMMGCNDPECREWANVEVISAPYTGETMYHISECQMEDADV